MKSSKLLIKSPDQEILAIELSKGITGELAIVSLNVLRELVNTHAHHVSLRELKKSIMERLERCADIHTYEDILSYDLAMLQLHRNLKAYDDAEDEKKNTKEPCAVMGRESFHSKFEEKKQSKKEYNPDSIERPVDRD